MSDPGSSVTNPRGEADADAVYLLWHTDAHDDDKLIGAYRTEDEALAAIERVKLKPGFADAGGRFEIARYELGQDHWTEGFVYPTA